MSERVIMSNCSIECICGIPAFAQLFMIIQYFVETARLETVVSLEGEQLEKQSGILCNGGEQSTDLEGSEAAWIVC